MEMNDIPKSGSVDIDERSPSLASTNYETCGECGTTSFEFNGKIYSITFSPPLESFSYCYPYGMNKEIIDTVCQLLEGHIEQDSLAKVSQEIHAHGMVFHLEEKCIPDSRDVEIALLHDRRDFVLHYSWKLTLIRRLYKTVLFSCKYFMFIARTLAREN